MDTYPCPACGGVADATGGCRSCGRAHDPVAQALAKLNAAMSGLEDETRQLAADQQALRTRRAQLQAQRTALTRAIALRLADEGPRKRRVPGQRPAAAPPRTPTATPAASTATAATPTTTTPATARIPTQATTARIPNRTAARANPTGQDGDETTPRSAQNTLLTLGGVLLGLAAIVFASLFYGPLLLVIATLLALGIPVLLAQRTLTATAETIASIGLLLVLLDGYNAYRADLAGIRAVPAPLFTAVLFLLVAGVAAAYRLATHLRAPQFAALLAVQPWLPLVAVWLHANREGYAVALALVAAGNLGAVSLFSTELKLLAAAGRRRRSGGTAPAGAWPRMLRELAWFLFGLSLAASAGLALAGLVRASTVGEAVRSALVVLLAAAVGVGGGQLSGRQNYREIATGMATLAILGSLRQVDALALPQFTLVLTAAVAAGIAVAAQFLPSAQRRGPQLGSLIGAALTALVVVVGALVTAAAAMRAAVTPRVWGADIGSYVAHVRSDDWQIPAAALLLAILAIAATPADWRVDAAALGGTAVLLTLPATGALSWWAAPLLGVLASTAATVTALFAPTGRNALIRSTVATLLGLFALVTGLARAELTAGVCALLTIVAAVTAIATAVRPDRFGPFADRVADAAVGAAALTLPVAVGAGAYLGGASRGVLLPLTLLAVAIGVTGAALMQVAAQNPRTAAGGGALMATIGGVLLAVSLGARPLDIGLAALLLAAAAVTVGSRAFEVTGVLDIGTGVVEGLESIPAAVGTLVDAVEGDPNPPARPTPAVRIDGRTMGAALATAGLIVALARVLSVTAPGIGLVITTAMVLLTSLGVRALPASWRRGPRLGGGVVGGVIVVGCAVVALIEAGRAVAAGLPYWHANLDSWTAVVTGYAPFGWQVPASLALAAVAAWVLLPAPTGGDLGFVTLALAGLALPASFAVAWWTPSLIAGVFALLAGVGAALVTRRDPVAVSYRRLGLAAILGLYAVAAADATAGLTAFALSTIMAVAVVVAAVGRARGVPTVVPGVAAMAALTAAPGAAATLAISAGATRQGVLAATLVVALLGVAVVWGLRAARAFWGPYPSLGVGLATLVVAAVDRTPVWAAASALVAAVAAAAIVTRTADTQAPGPRERVIDRRVTMAVFLTTVAPAAALAAAVSAPAWLTALVGPFGTLRQVWAGYASTPAPTGTATAVPTLLLLTGVAATVALSLGGGRYLLSAVLGPVAALVLILPDALGAPRGATSWAALGIAIATGLGAALSPPTLPAAARLLRGTAAIVCAVAGASGIAGSLATRSGTLTALAILTAAGVAAATLGRDPAVRMASWTVASLAAIALPVTAVAAAGGDLRPAAFGVLGVSAGLTAIAWLLARTELRRAEAAVAELCAWIGATFALLLTLSSPRYAAAVLTICGLLLGAAALRRDRPAARRRWLVRAALGAEVAACWLLLYSVRVGLPEAYTLPFAAVAILGGALELSRRRELSSWVAYGPALLGGFLPSLGLVLINDVHVWRWITLFAAAIVTVLLGSWRRRLAPVVTGAGVAIIVAVVEMIRLLAGGKVGGAILVAVAGLILIGFGALSEQRLRGALRRMS